MYLLVRKLSLDEYDVTHMITMDDSTNIQEAISRQALGPLFHISKVSLHQFFQPLCTVFTATVQFVQFLQPRCTATHCPEESTGCTQANVSFTFVI